MKKSADDLSGTIVPYDTVIDELRVIAEKHNIESKYLAKAMAVYMLGFESHIGLK